MSTILSFLRNYWQGRHPHRWPNRAALEAWQERQVISHVQRVLPLSPYYRELFAGQPASEWRSIPITTKATMMAQFDRLNTAGIRRDEAMALALRAEQERDFRPRLQGITVGLSSGTSGHRGLFLVSDEEQAAWAATILGKLLPGPLWRPERIALFLRAGSNLYESVGRGPWRFRYFDLQLPLEQHRAVLQQYQPTLLVAPPSVLRYLADDQQRGLLGIAPRRVIAVAEVLDPADAQQINLTFAPPLHQVYQCTEGFLGVTCSHGTLHLNEDVALFEREYLDQRRFIPIITDFRRFTQPILRYRLDDVLVERAEPCPCGSPFLALDRIEGRKDDVLELPDRATGHLRPVWGDLITRAIIRSAAAIAEYRVVQHADLHLEVQLRLEDEAEQEAHAHVMRALEQLCDQLSVEMPAVRFAPYQAPPPSQKLRRVQRIRQ